MHQRVHREADAGIGEIDDRRNALLIDPAAGDRKPDIGLVLMVGEDDLDPGSAAFRRKILRRHLRCDIRAMPDLIGKRSGKVAQDADLELPARDLGVGGDADRREESDAKR